MAESHPQHEEAEREQEVEVEKRRLRHLEFVRVAAVQALMCLAGLYSFAKGNAGPIRPGVEAVEAAVRGAVGPVYDRFHSVPFHLLAFADRKVDDTVKELDRHLPPVLKAASAQACAVARAVPEVAQELASELQQSGLTGVARSAYEKIEPVARDLYVRYEPAAEHIAVATWRSLNSLPLFPQVAQIVVPTASYWAEKYNKAIGCAAARGYAGAQYLPPIPTERIAKMFGEGRTDSAALPEPASGPLKGEVSTQ